MQLASTSISASASPGCFSWLRSPAGVFRSSASPPASLWLSLLGVLLRWLNLFLTTACDCGLSSSDSTDLRIVWFSRLRCLCHRGVSATSCSAPPSSPLFRCVSLPGVSRPTLWSECFPVFSPRSWGAYLDRQIGSGLCGWRRLCFLSTPGACWPSGYVFILPGSYHILADTLYRPLLLPRSAWSLALTVFLSFRVLRPVQHCFFASSPYRCCPIYFSADNAANGQCQRTQTCFSILRAVSRLTRLLQWPSFLLFWPSSGRPLGRRSLSWLLFGPCAPGSRTCSSIGWTIL